jgi:AraC family transcriptional regulator
MRDVTRIDWHSRVEKAIGRIMRSLDEPLSFRAISVEVCASPYHFHRKFRELTGESVHGCVRRLRLERSMSLLRNTDGTITDIALDCGYETPEAFSKAFKAVYGLKPTEARRFRNWDGLIYSKAGLHYDERNKSRWFYINSKGDDSVETKIISFPTKRVVGVQNTGDYWGLPKAWEKFHKILGANDLYKSGKEFMCVFPDHDDKIPMSEKKSYAGMVVDADFDNRYSLSEMTIQEGLYAVTVHFGSSEEIGPTWDRWNKEWLPESGWSVDTSRPMYEWYQNQCVEPELLLTFLCTPVKKT